MPRNKPTAKAVPTCEIPTSKFEITVSDNLDFYLEDDFNYEIYLSLRSMYEKEDHLRFFQTFYSKLSFLKANLSKPLAVETAVKSHGIILWRTLIQYADLPGNGLLSQSRAIQHIRVMARQSDEEVKVSIGELYDAYNLGEERKLREIDEKVENDARDRGLTARRLMYLLDSEMPIFKNATTNTARGELAYMLTGLGGVTKDGKRGEAIRQDYSTYSKRITDEDRRWLEDWKAKLKKVPRNKGGTL